MVHIKQCILEENKVIVFIDHREANNNIINILKNLGVEVKKIELKIGDFLLSEEICIERKTSRDFVRSIIDGRLFGQLRDLVDNFKKPILLIEGNVFNGISENALHGAIASIILDFNVPIIMTKNLEETAKMIAFLAKREKKSGKRILIHGKKKPHELKEIQQKIVASIPGIGTEISKNLLKYFGSVENIFNASESELMKVDKIGRKKAKRIRYILSAKYE